MGNSQSSATKEETRRANRLSKPLTRKLAALSSPSSARTSIEGPELNTGLIGWQNPWVGSNISTEVRNSHGKPREIPPTLFETEPGPSNEEAVMESPIQSPVVQVQDEPLSPLSPLSSTVSSRHSVRRASYQPGTYSGSPQLSYVPQHPRRANSVQTTLTRHNSVIYENTYEDATSSNTHFLVGNQRFSLTRRRSLLTRPGVATRRTTPAASRVPSPIGEPRDPLDELNDSSVLKWPLPPRQRTELAAAPLIRPTSPPDSQYTQLGALKLGSLRVVNGSASPCPSERIPLTHTGLGLGNVDTMGRIKSTLEIPAVPDLKKSDDVPGSPFSFEKSPIVTAAPPSKSIFPSELEDEGIAMFDDGISQPHKVAADNSLERSTTHSLNKSDSGYSSAASVSSYHHSRPRASFDSQTSGSCTADGRAKTIWVTSDQSRSDHREEIQRHFSLHEAKYKTGNYSRLYPNFDRWYDSIGPVTEKPLAALRTRRSTLCAPRYTEYPAQKAELDSAGTMGAAAVHEEQIYSRGRLYADRCSTSGLDVSHSLGSTTSLGTDTPPSYQRGSSSARSQMHRSASERYLGAKAKGNHELPAHRSRSRSRPGSRVWSQKPGFEVPPLPTIMSPDHLHGGEEDWDRDLYASETIRGRPRSRSQDYRRRKLIKAHPQAEIHM